MKLAEKGKSPNENFDLTITNIARVIKEAPVAGKEIPSNCYTVDCLASAAEVLQGNVETDKRTFEVVESYFQNDFVNMHHELRSSILETFYAFANPFRSGMLWEYFSQDVSDEIKPENTFGNENENGKIIILDFSVKEYLELGIYAQTIYKRLWQMRVEKREVTRATKPVFMWVDESQFFLSEDDMRFQTTARSSRACTVMISQNISNYYASMGGQGVEARVNSLLGNLSTKIFHANNEYVTNEWAANTIGKTFRTDVRVNSKNHESDASFIKSLNYQIEPQAFTLLRNGGEMHNFLVEGILTTSGKAWSNGKNHLKVFFNQVRDNQL